MVSITHNMLKETKINGLYSLCILASKRAQAIAEGSKPLVETRRRQKVTTIALQEIVEGKAEWYAGKEPEGE